MGAPIEEPIDLTEMNAMIEANLPLVKHIVLQVAVHFPRHVEREELARAGSLGLVEAARRFDESRGVPFDRFAAQRIRGAILDAVRAADWAPRSVRTLARKLEATEQRLASKLGRVPTTEEMAEALSMETNELARLRDRMFRSVVLALEHEVSDDVDDDLTLVDVLVDHGAIEPSEELETRELHAYLRDAIALLPERQRLVIIGYFLEGRTSQDLARFLGVTESRISQIRSEAIQMLKEGIEAQYLAEGTMRPEPRARKLEATEQRLASKLGRVPTTEEMAEALSMETNELARLRDRMFRSVVLALEHEVSDDVDDDLTLVDVLVDHGAIEPSEELETRELHAYLRDAIALLPERQRLVIIGYFLEGRTSQDLARFLGVTESRISQIRSEAIQMLKEGIEAQYLAEGTMRPEPRGRSARRKAAYVDAIGDRSDWHDRMEQITLIESSAPEVKAGLPLS